MLREKSAQGMPITVIVAAVIGLIIIVVIVMVLTGKLGAFGKGLEEQEKFGKKCNDYDEDNKNAELKAACAATGETEIITSDSIATGKKCCKPN